VGKSDREAKRKAEAAWKRIKVQAEHEAEQAKPHRAEYEKVIAEWTSVLTWAMDHGDETTAAVARDKLVDLEQRLSERVPLPLGWADRFFAGPAPLDDVNKRMQPAYHEAGLVPVRVVEGPVPAELTAWKDRLEAQSRRLDQVGCDDTFASNVERFLQEKRNEVAAGQLSAARADSLRTYLDIVMEYTGRTTSVASIDQGTLPAFRNHLLQRLAAKEISDYYARDVFSAFRLFVRWLANNTNKLEHLPKNIDDKKLSISVAVRKVKTLPPDQLQIVLKAANARTRLYLLLGLNCGMTQQDISDLHPSEVDWSQGVITRKRSKTSDCENVPVVSYRLWSPTFQLLRQERSPDEDRVLLTRDGKPLKTESIDERNKFKKTDAVRLTLRRLVAKTGVRFTMKMLKKTAASLLRNHREYRGLESLFLDHAPVSVSDRHYAGVPQDLLDEAIEWLGSELGVSSVSDDLCPRPIKNHT
jgi:integrase